MKKQITIFFAFFLLTIIKLFAQNKVVSFEIPSHYLKTSKKIWVYLPENYETSRKKFPVLYLQDGQNLFDSKTAYSGEWQIDETLDSLKAEIIVVGIAHGNENRLQELTPFVHQQYGGGGASAYLDFITNELMPYIQVNYRIKNGKYNTGIGGSSLGGLFAMYASLKHPKLFGKVLVFSPSFWINPEIYEVANSLKATKSKYYFMCGTDESATLEAETDKMIGILNEKRCSCLHLTKKKIVVGGKHNEKLWSKEFAKAYLWLF